MAQCQGVARLEFECALDLPFGLVELAATRQCGAEIVVCVGVVRPLLEGTAQCLLGTVDVASLQHHPAAAAPRQSIVRCRRQHLVVQRQRVAETFALIGDAGQLAQHREARGIGLLGEPQQFVGCRRVAAPAP